MYIDKKPQWVETILKCEIAQIPRQIILKCELSLVTSRSDIGPRFRAHLQIPCAAIYANLAHSVSKLKHEFHVNLLFYSLKQF